MIDRLRSAAEIRTPAEANAQRRKSGCAHQEHLLGNPTEAMRSRGRIPDETFGAWKEGRDGRTVVGFVRPRRQQPSDIYDGRARRSGGTPAREPQRLGSLALPDEGITLAGSPRSLLRVEAPVTPHRQSRIQSEGGHSPTRAAIEDRLRLSALVGTWGRHRVSIVRDWRAAMTKATKASHCPTHPNGVLLWPGSQRRSHMLTQCAPSQWEIRSPRS